MLKSNPLVSILFNPKETIRTVVDKNPKHFLWFLCSIHGFICLFSCFQNLSLGLYLPSWLILGLSLVFSPIVGYVLISLGTWIIRGGGLLLGARGSFANIRASYAYAQVPLIGFVLIELILLCIFGKRMFIHFPAGQNFELHEVFVLYAAIIFQIIFVIWSILILIKTLSEVRLISISRAILNLIIACFIYSLVVFLVSLPFIDRCSNFFDFPEITKNDFYDTWRQTWL